MACLPAFRSRCQKFAAIAGALWLGSLYSVSAQPVVQDSPLISVVESATGRVVAPQTVEILSVRVTDRGGVPLADRTVVFAAPDSAAAGVFPGSQTPNATFIRVQTSAGGIAETTFQTGNTPGVFLVEATVEDTDGSATFALTNIPGLPEPVLSPEDARAQVAADVLGGTIEDENLGLHGRVSDRGRLCARVVRWLGGAGSLPVQHRDTRSPRRRLPVRGLPKRPTDPSARLHYHPAVTPYPTDRALTRLEGFSSLSYECAESPAAASSAAWSRGSAEPLPSYWKPRSVPTSGQPTKDFGLAGFPQR